MNLRLIAALCMVTAWQAHAQSYPSRPVRMLVASSAGSSPDLVARLLASALGEALGQQIVIDNRAGAAGNIGGEISARAAPDGYTVLLAHTNHTINASLYRELAYDLLTDFAPVTLVSLTPYAAAVHPSLPVKSCSELVTIARQQQGKLNYASAGTGSGTFFVAEYFNSLARMKMVHVPYKGGGPAMGSVVAGETQVYFPPVGPGLPQFRSGRLRPLGVSTAQRLPELPDVAPIAETLPGFEMVGWAGIVVPVKTPKAIVQRLHEATLKVLQRPDVKKSLSDQGYVVVGSQPAEMRKYLVGENEKYARLIRELGMPRE